MQQSSMHDNIYINGEAYTPASRASRIGGIPQDQLLRLCRSGALRAKRVGRQWYVHMGSVAVSEGTAAHMETDAPPSRGEPFFRMDDEGRALERESRRVETDFSQDPSFRSVYVQSALDRIARTGLPSYAHVLADTYARMPTSPLAAPLYSLAPLSDLFHKIIFVLVLVAVESGAVALARPQQGGSPNASESVVSLAAAAQSLPGTLPAAFLQRLRD